MVYAKQSRDDGYTELKIGDRSVSTGYNVQALADDELQERYTSLLQFHKYARSFSVARKIITSSVVFFLPSVVFGLVPTASNALGLSAGLQEIVRLGSLGLLLVSLFTAAVLLSYRAYLSHRVLSALTNELRRLEREMRRRGLDIPEQ